VPAIVLSPAPPVDVLLLTEVTPPLAAVSVVLAVMPAPVWLEPLLAMVLSVPVLFAFGLPLHANCPDSLLAPAVIVAVRAAN